MQALGFSKGFLGWGVFFRGFSGPGVKRTAHNATTSCPPEPERKDMRPELGEEALPSLYLNFASPLGKALRRVLEGFGKAQRSESSQR